MKRGPQLAITLGILSATWASVFFYAPLSPAVEQVVVLLPYTALIWFGCYSLATISINMLTFNECPEAAASLLEEIRDARDDLRKKGITID